MDKEVVFQVDVRTPWHILSYRKYYVDIDYAVCGERKQHSTRRMASNVAQICPKCLEIRSKD